MSFSQKFQQQASNTGIPLSMPRDTNVHVKVPSVSGKILNLKKSQLTTLHSHRATHLFSAQPLGTIDANTTHIYLRPANVNGWIKEVYLMAEIQNSTGNDIRLLPFDQWVDRINYTMSSKIITEEYGITYHDNISKIDHDTWQPQGKFMGYNPNGHYMPGLDVLVNGDTRRYYLRIARFLEQTGFFYPAYTAELDIEVNWNPFARYAFSGTLPTLNKLQVEVVSDEQLDFVRKNKIIEVRREPHHYRFHDEIRQTVTSVISASSTIEIILNGFLGPISEISVYMRPTGATLRDLLSFETFAIKEIELLGSDNKRIFSTSEFTKEEDTLYYLDTLHRNNFIEESNHYKLMLSQSILDSKTGAVSGYYPLDNQSRLLIRFHAAVRPTVMTLTAGGAATVGNCRFKYVSQKYGVFYSVWDAFNTSVAQWKINIEAMTIFEESNTSITMNATLAAGAASTITFGGNGGLARLDQKALLIIEGDATFDANYDTTITTRWRDGVNSTNVEFLLLGKRNALLTLQRDGNVDRK